MSLNISDVKAFIEHHSLQNKVISLHSSFKSLGEVDGGPEMVISTFLEAGCTLLVPTHSWDYLAPPTVMHRPIRNAWNYSTSWSYKNLKPFTPQSLVIDSDMGILAKTILALPDAIRGDNPLCSFTSIGPLSKSLIQAQRPMDVTAPMRELISNGGVVLCIGVDLTKVTLLHYIEQYCGRKPFLRWAHSSDNDIIPVQVGGCSEGFNQLYQSVSNCLTTSRLGNAHSLLFKAEEMLHLASDAINERPEITRCKTDCPVCTDTIAGGPLY